MHLGDLFSNGLFKQGLNQWYQSANQAHPFLAFTASIKSLSSNRIRSYLATSFSTTCPPHVQSNNSLTFLKHDNCEDFM